MPPLTIASLPIAQPSFLQDSLAGQALVGKGLAGAHAGLQAAPAVLGAVAPSRPRVPTTWAKSRKAPSASVRAQGAEAMPAWQTLPCTSCQDLKLGCL